MTQVWSDMLDAVNVLMLTDAEEIWLPQWSLTQWQNEVLRGEELISGIIHGSALEWHDVFFFLLLS